VSDCIFCKIAAGDIPTEKLVDTPEVIAFRDLNPQAPHHILVIPRRHVAKLSDLSEADNQLLGGLITAANKLAADMGLDKSGYRLVINNGASAGQSVWHLHVHLLGGRDFQWPPG
jgi:histidine triad (HIT) family protein